MDFFSDLLNAMPGALAQGLIWGLMAIGVYITFKVLDLPDLTVDGTMCTGGAVCIMLMTHGVNVWVALVVAFVAGLAAGALTGLFHTAMGIPRHPGRYPLPAGPVLHQPADHGRQGQPGHQPGQLRPAGLPPGTCASWPRTTPSWWACSSPR